MILVFINFKGVFTRALRNRMEEREKWIMNWHY